MGPIGPELLSYDLARTVLRDPQFVVPTTGIHLSSHGIASGPLWDRVTRSLTYASNRAYKEPGSYSTGDRG